MKLEDLIQINLDPKLTELDDSQKIEIVDNLGEGPQRGLVVTFDLSHSGRMINRRIYQPWAQQDGIPSWTNPVSKPILRYHDGSEDAIGRILEAEYVDLSNEAIAFLGSQTVFAEVKDAFDSRNREKIHKVMNKHGLLDNKDWPGLGKVRVKARISDKDAVQKFLDQRYLQFSAGQVTDKVECSKCGTHVTWFDGCDHIPGVRTEDGDIPFMMTNTLDGKEASVVNNPADDLSKVVSMVYDVLEDSEGRTEPTLHAEAWHTDAIYICDSEADIVVPQKKEEVLVEKESLDALMSELKALKETVSKLSASKEEQEDEEEQEEILDWEFLDLALTGLLGSKALDKDTRDSLADESFCGPNRTFPLTTQDQCDIALKLLDRYSGPGDKEALATDINTRKETLVPVLDEEKVKELQSKLDEANGDLANALAQVQDSEEKLSLVLEKLAKYAKTSIKDMKTLDEKMDWFGKLEDDKILNVSDIQDVGDPTGTQQEIKIKKTLDELSTFERKIIERYKSITKDSGKESAEQYIVALKTKDHLSASFQISDYLD